MKSFSYHTWLCWISHRHDSMKLRNTGELVWVIFACVNGDQHVNHSFLGSFELQSMTNHFINNHVLSGVKFTDFLSELLSLFAVLESFFILWIELPFAVWSCDEVGVNLIVMTAPIDVQVKRDDKARHLWCFFIQKFVQRIVLTLNFRREIFSLLNLESTQTLDFNC